MAQKIVAGNWKMNLSSNEAKELMSNLNEKSFPSDVRTIVFPSSIYVDSIASTAKNTEVGVQNFSENDNGAFTGEVSIEQLRSVNVNIGLIGHSERRAYFKEGHEQLKNKVDHAIKNEFNFIFCCGEPLAIRENGDELTFVRLQLNESLFHLIKEQMMNKVIAYEPVWAIGTGKTASSDQAEEMHRNIRSWIEEKYDLETAESVSILYGGSCKPSNAKELFACKNVDGGLIGGAALKADDFNALIHSF